MRGTEEGLRPVAEKVAADGGRMRGRAGPPAQAVRIATGLPVRALIRRFAPPSPPRGEGLGYVP